ncbi:RESISTANCE TO PSEUDOMONAS SYRINGAE 3, RESISTANCE TO P. SYRINGAE PV MACULICOLA 1 [Hibiscus trionum]|uniref:RESISTANCE TO PSEUDOMONAS SYRINGAE 3, RESISTANCE TO P. SYRINGAE PV MACULICOLA 1 n=1 Tax=Hibiscus trionum TaxID=183268 RepID=A0A9W7MDF6_HIBTR|nr:RESISTANCE TO PSEUDOMONAS SYRINGAE 3, RESISTANCE TO P. SYRINGAE PV MACULICOLA 1 [Hibiscus trionum]
MSSSSVDFVLDRLLTLLQNEASSLLGVPDEIREMKLLLESMRSFLVDSDRVGAGSQTQKLWVKNVRELAYEVEDVIDGFTYHKSKRQQWKRDNTWKRGNTCKRFLQRSLHFPKDCYVRHQVAAKLQDINKRMTSITEKARQFGVQQLEERGTTSQSHYDPNWKNRLSESSLFFKDEDLVGIKKAQHELLGWLMAEEPQRTVISVVGMGGSGKTTFVANTFNKQSVKQQFEFCTWITVSQQYAIEELFRSIVKDIYKQTTGELSLLQIDTMTYRGLVETLVHFLQLRKYLIVLDDVWSIHFWREINIAFPEGMRGSRIVVTTRRQDAVPCQSGFVSHVHQIQPLGMNDAWGLFCKKAFLNDLEGCPSHLDESLARNLVEKCEGLPLAIAALGGLMSSKRSISEWKRVHENLAWELSNNPSLEIMKTISMLSYHDLSFQLKQCFLYCSLFPEDYEFRRKRIMRLWMAEGFLKRADDVQPEAVAEGYLMELVSRSLLQVVWRNEFGRPRKLKMHDLIRDFALSMAKEESFVAEWNGDKGVEEEGIHRYSVRVKDKEMTTGNGTSQLRSLIVFVVDESSKFNKLPSGLKLLRVLDLENAPIDEVPGEFGDLFNLRYLNLSRTRVKVLPKSVGKLFNLQTLLLRYSQIKKLPNEIVKLQNLRHLSAFYLLKSELVGINIMDDFLSIEVPPNICMIKSLQVLSHFRVTSGLLIKLKEMEELRRIGLDGLTEGDEEHLCTAIQRMQHLHNLSLGSLPRVPLKLDALPSAPPYLEKLFLNGKLGKVPRWFDTLLNLKLLSLQHSELWGDTIPHIQTLPNLLQLDLVENAFMGERLCFVEGFKKLQRLNTRGLYELKEIVIENGAMPVLESLIILRCKQLRRLPHGWEHRTHLKMVRLYDVSSEVVESICGEGRDHLPTKPHILLTRTDEVEPKWVHQILN